MCRSQSGKIRFPVFPPEQVGYSVRLGTRHRLVAGGEVPQHFNSGLASASRNRRDPLVPFLIPFIVQKCCPVRPQHPLCGCQCSQTHNPCLFLWPRSFFSQLEALDIGFQSGIDNRVLRQFSQLNFFGTLNYIFNTVHVKFSDPYYKHTQKIQMEIEIIDNSWCDLPTEARSTCILCTPSRSARDGIR